MAPRRSRSLNADPQLLGEAPDAAPYPPSWLDRIQDWLKRLPVPLWTSYLIAALALSLLGHVLRWLDGSLPPGSLEVNQLAGGFFPIYFFGFIHYLNSSARKAIANYRPLLDLNNRDYASLEYTLTRLPRRVGLLAILLGTFIGGLNFFSSPEAWGVQPSFAVLSRAALLMGALAGNIAATYWIFQVIRQARTIDRIHQLTKRVNIFRRDAVYSFSSLTLRSALGAIIFVYSYLFINLYLGLAVSAIDMVTTGIGIALSLAIFFLPLSRMHGRLAAEKHGLLLDADERYTLLVERFNRQVDKANFDKGSFIDMDSNARVIAALAAQREAVTKISTWPWRPETLRSLLSTVAAPIVLYLVSRLLGRFFGV
jgi:hypothetical protein